MAVSDLPGDEALDDRVPLLARLEREDRAALLAIGRVLRYTPRSVVWLLLRGWTEVTAIAATGTRPSSLCAAPASISTESPAALSRAT